MDVTPTVEKMEFATITRCAGSRQGMAPLTARPADSIPPPRQRRGGRGGVQGVHGGGHEGAAGPGAVGHGGRRRRVVWSRARGAGRSRARSFPPLSRCPSIPCDPPLPKGTAAQRSNAVHFFNAAPAAVPLKHRAPRAGRADFGPNGRCFLRSGGPGRQRWCVAGESAVQRPQSDGAAPRAAEELFALCEHAGFHFDREAFAVVRACARIRPPARARAADACSCVGARLRSCCASGSAPRPCMPCCGT